MIPTIFFGNEDQLHKNAVLIYAFRVMYGNFYFRWLLLGARGSRNLLVFKWGTRNKKLGFSPNFVRLLTLKFVGHAEHVVVSLKTLVNATLIRATLIFAKLIFANLVLIRKNSCRKLFSKV